VHGLPASAVVATLRRPSALFVAIWFVPVGMLLLAPLPLSGNYYVWLRIVVGGWAALAALASWERHERFDAWVLAFGIVAVLFNPLLPISLDRPSWAPIDIAVAGLFVLHWRTFGRHGLTASEAESRR
jgi:hypothetical protein